MQSNIQLWKHNEAVTISEQSEPISGIIKKICNIEDRLYVLADQTLYHGLVENLTVCLSIKKGLIVKNFDVFKEVFVVDDEGQVWRFDEKLESSQEVCLVEEGVCLRGHQQVKRKYKVSQIAVGKFGLLFVCENGKLWAAGFMSQIGVGNDCPKMVKFFAERRVYAINVGDNFALALVSKQPQDNSEDSDDEEEVFNNNCLQCKRSASQLTSPASQTSISDLCPLGVKLPASYDIETTSTSSKYDSSQASDKEDTSQPTVQKNIIFRNTEAAKDFLTRQISRMSSAGEEYLVECTEKPTKIIKENMTNVASFVYEGVRTVGDKVATLSRHVSGSSDCNSTQENEEDFELNQSSSKDDLSISLTNGLSNEGQETELQDNIDSALLIGSNLLNCELWTWGNLTHGQLGNNNLKRERPLIITKLSNIGVQKLCLKSFHAAALTLDGRAFLWGQNNYNQVTIETFQDRHSPKQFVLSENQRILDVCVGNNFTIISTKNDLIYFGQGSNSHEISLGNTEGSIHTSSEFILLQNHLINENINFFFGEQVVVEEMITTYQIVIKPLLKSASELFEKLCKSYTNLLHFFVYCLSTNFSKNQYKMWLNIYKNYSKDVLDVISIDGVSSIARSIEIPVSLYKLRPEIAKKDRTSDVQLLENLLMSPITRLEYYISIFSDQKWHDFHQDCLTKQKHSEETRKFWPTLSKNLEFLKSHTRRWVRDSHQNPITLQNANRFSSHWFILFTDVFVHVNGSTVSLHDLTTIWLDCQQEESVKNYQIVLKMPENTLVLQTNNAENKIEWFHVLQQTIKNALGKPEVPQLPVTRTACYTFLKTGFLKNATYTGRWMNGRMNGRGKLEWPNGQKYSGHFVNNQLNGFGTMIIPKTGVYEGQWKDNQQNGFGTFTYDAGNEYKGNFKDGVPHGHGYFRQGNFMANTASFYVGDWTSGLKSGYGVIDDIIKGEKYIGSWSDNKKHGNGLIVTDETYCEGLFNQDTLTGQGLLVLEDGVQFEGEFRSTGILNGKGTIKLPTGHVIDGYLTGACSDGVKISNGTFLSGKNCRKEPDNLGVLCTPVNQKWRSLITHCHQVLGINETNNGKSVETQKIWQNVAVCLSNTSTLKKFLGDKSMNSLNNLDRIPPFGRDKLDDNSFNSIKQYLVKAFESNSHPLGFLMVNLIEAYTTTYGGRAHPFLLKHAINELMYICKCLYEIVRLLFPALPNYGQDTIIESSDEIVTWQSLLYPIILPKVYHPLFTLFTLHNESKEKHYKHVLKEWNRQSDYNLMSHLSVDKKFLKEEPIHNVFLDAIETLQQVKSTFSPAEKILVIRQTVEKMTPVAQEILGKDYIWSMDDLFPMFLYVVIRAQIADLGSELDYINNFMDASLEKGELSIMFTTLQACYQQILQENTFPI